MNQELLDALKGIPYEKNVPMMELTTFKVGGPADVVCAPRTPEEAAHALKSANALGVPVLVMGNGSNLLVHDGGVRGMVLLIGENMNSVRRQGNLFTVAAGHSLTALARHAIGEGYQGLEWACGIPGTVGGACAMNAGAYGGQMKDVLKSVTVLEKGEIKKLIVGPEDLGYRKSVFCAPHRVVLEAQLALAPDDGGAKTRMAQCMNMRREKQPLNLASAGSTFKRPPGYFAGKLIEDAGLKGFSIGGAQVSEKHAGFVVNTGTATAADILALIRHIRRTVQESAGVTLELEVKIVGEPL